MQSDVKRSHEGIAGSQEAQSFQRKGGEGGKAAENPCEQKQAGRVAEDAAGLGNDTEPPDQGAANNVNGQCPPGNDGEWEQALHGIAGYKAADGAGKSPETDKENVIHGQTGVPWIRVVVHVPREPRAAPTQYSNPGVERRIGKE